MFTINPSRSDFLIEVNGKKGFNLIKKGDCSGLQMVPRQTKALNLGCTAMQQRKLKFQPWAVHNSIPG
jgi:hypothetical protein